MRNHISGNQDDIGGKRMSRMKALKERADEYAKEHREAFESWTHGEIVSAWLHEGNPDVVCVRYEDGRYWHYKETPEGLRWW